jgi:hypothetical protein
MSDTISALQICPRGRSLPGHLGSRAAVSLHGHSSCSRETLDFVPGLARQIPVVSRLVERSLERYEQMHGRPLDFASWYWRPPLGPAAVIASEHDHLEARLSCRALVSLTDHDTFEGPRTLREAGRDEVPLSVEWSIPFEGTMFHVGAHAIASARLDEVARVFADYTAGRIDGLGDILDWLNETPETFIILNHPCWDLTGAGALRHDAVLLQFLRTHRHRIHGVELNGYRTWAENRRVLPLADGFGLPLVGGGDRHGLAPNSIVNLTDAASLGEFAQELRAGRQMPCVVFEEYMDPFGARLLQGARDCLSGVRQGGEAGAWTDRVFFTADGVDETPLAALWNGAPWWLSGSVGVARLLGSDVARSMFRLATPGRNHVLRSDLGPARPFGALPRLDTPPA